MTPDQEKMWDVLKNPPIAEPLYFNATGTKLYIPRCDGQTLQYNLSTAFDLSSMTIAY